MAVVHAHIRRADGSATVAICKGHDTAISIATAVGARAGIVRYRDPVEGTIYLASTTALARARAVPFTFEFVESSLPPRLEFRAPDILLDDEAPTRVGRRVPYSAQP
jgi:hypothetical protein